MSSRQPRMTLVVMDILDAVMSAPPDSPAWGLMICEATGHGPSSIYPALDRLLKAGWIEDEWEEPQPEDRPRRRFYTVTAVGQAAYQEAVASRAARRTAWGRTGLQQGGTA